MNFPRILLLEDSDLDAELLEAQLRRDGADPEITRVIDRGGFVRELDRGGYDLVLSDYSLPDFDGMGALELVRTRSTDLPFIFVSGVLGEEIAIESFQKGATDYVLKQRLNRLPAAISRALAEAREKAERRRAEEQLQLLVAELSHRVKNTLAMVVSIAQQTLRRSTSLADFETAFIGRLQTLANAHSLLFQANWGETALSEIVERTLQPFRRGPRNRFDLSGPAVMLSPKAALSLSLILHELATNAAKYGALTAETGKVELRWFLHPEGGGQQLRMEWRENGGPLVRAPARRGFGTQLIERSAAYELDGSAELTFAPDGLRLDLSVPLI